METLLEITCLAHYVAVAAAAAFLGVLVVSTAISLVRNKVGDDSVVGSASVRGPAEGTAL
jgi:hypothetical protein